MKVIACLVICLAAAQGGESASASQLNDLEAIFKQLNIPIDISGITQEVWNDIPAGQITDIITSLTASIGVTNGLSKISPTEITGLTSSLTSALIAAKIPLNSTCVTSNLAKLNNLQSQFSTCLSSLTNVLSKQTDLVKGIVSLVGKLTKLSNADLVDTLLGIVDSLLSVVQGLLDTVLGLVTSLTSVLSDLSDTCGDVTGLTDLVSQATNTVNDVKECVKTSTGKVLNI